MSDSLLDEMAIRALVVEERYCRDTDQFEALRRCYHPDPSKTFIDIIRYHGDIDGFLERSSSMAGQGTSSIHTINPVQITLNGDKAFSVSLGSIISRFSQDGVDYDLVSQCRFLSRLERTGEEARRGWKMLSMQVIYVQDAITPAFPAELRDDVNDAVGEGMASRESYRGLAYVLAQMGDPVTDTLPGTDDPGSVEALQQQNLSWVHE
ncbi:hypothetical protein ASPVEDRAFT_526796 [Aspergillus versicolor CBS 583.65]|uniref:SnoaL-like domain-containing protein n=1 Tax=Aspergillus versicolor CBS 583.65 TaxID=1036611 RepID=A0A1L9PEA6_ASPVE|nr:uncharacterized protein ASPVEDRAFT_526796 [Aspergillus versicolor CBS 583.65]OJI99818.1 hypothetical protein ASPVEDRAFT_526796 [Aspergillus versicolor CBS 583.65]